MATHIVTTQTLVCGTVALVLNAVFAWGAVESTAYLPPERGLAVQLLAQSQHASQQRRMAALHISQASSAALVE
jgi:hypothetical protein